MRMDFSFNVWAVALNETTTISSCKPQPQIHPFPNVRHRNVVRLHIAWSGPCALSQIDCNQLRWCQQVKVISQSALSQSTCSAQLGSISDYSIHPLKHT